MSNGKDETVVHVLFPRPAARDSGGESGTVDRNGVGSQTEPASPPVSVIQTGDRFVLRTRAGVDLTTLSASEAYELADELFARSRELAHCPYRG